MKWAFWLLGLSFGGDCNGLLGCWECHLVVIVTGCLVVGNVIWW